jgi:hypothetical protein
MSATRSLINKYAGANAPNVGIAVTETNGSKYSDTAPQGMVSSGASCEPALNTPFPSYYGTEMISKLGSPGDTLVSASSSTSLVSAHAVKRANGDVDVMLINKDPNNAASVSLSYNGFTPGTGTPTVYSYLKNGHSITSAATGSAGNQTVPAYSVAVVQLHPSGGGSGGGSTGELHAAGAGKCLDVNGASTTAGTQTQIWDCLGGANQIWTHTASNQLTVYSGSTQMCLDVNGGGTADGTPLELWTCNGQSNQRWQHGSA